ncbi:hypothetical protein BTM408_15230 [Helicobacter pylori]
MAVRFGVIFITDNTSEITAFMVFTNESEFKKLLKAILVRIERKVRV